MREIFAAQFGLPLANVQVITPDVGGAFGMKLAAYPDEMAVAAIAVLLGRPVKFVADRLESFVSDVHAREVKVKGRLAVDASGTLLAMDVAVLHGMGAYSSYPRGSVGEGLQAVHMSAAPYRLAEFQRPPAQLFPEQDAERRIACGRPADCVYRHRATASTWPRARSASTRPKCAGATTALRIRSRYPQRRRHRADRTVARPLSRQAAVADELRRACAPSRPTLRRAGIYRGIGLAAFIEQTGVGPQLYGPLDVRVSAHETCRLSLEPNGEIRCATSVTDQGQGTLTALRQIVGTTLGVGIDAVEIVSGDTTAAPFGGGAWASRGTALGGESALRAARQLRTSILTIAGSILQAQPDSLRIEGGAIVNTAGLAQLSLADIASAAHYKSHTIPLEDLPPLDITERFTSRDLPYLASNGVQAAHVEVDPGLGTVKLLGFWVVDDCGTVDQSAAGGRADPGRRGAGHRRRLVRGVHLQRERATRERNARGLSGADGRRDAGHPGRAYRDADQQDQSRRARRGRGRNGCRGRRRSGAR